MQTANSNSDTKIQEENQEENGKQFEEMYKAGVHFGYSRSSRYPAMQPYLFGVRNNVEIFNLEKVNSCLEKAEEFLRELGSKSKPILLAATKAESRNLIQKAASELGMPYVNERWLGGTLTNFKTVRGQMNSYEELKKQKEAGEFSKRIKKEAVKLEKKLEKLERKFSGMSSLREIPSAVIIIDPKEESAAVLEARKMKVPVIAVANSDCDPNKIEYIIPGNDAASSSIEYFLGRLGAAYKEGLKNKDKQEKKEEKKEEKVKEA